MEAQGMHGHPGSLQPGAPQGRLSHGGYVDHRGQAEGLGLERGNGRQLYAQYGPVELESKIPAELP